MINRDRPERRPFVAQRVVVTIAVLMVAVVTLGIATLLLTARAPVDVPDLIGLDEDVARVRLAQADLLIEISERPFDPSPAGTVLNQEPAPGETLVEGDSVYCVVSAGSEEFTMPDVLGVSVRIARAQLEQRGLTVRIDPVESEAPKDTVLASNPAPGAVVRTSDIVRLTIAAEGSAADALLPYPLQGLVIAVDPAIVASGTVDAPMEVARRLQSLLEASGATVHMSRSASALDTSTSGRLAQIADTSPTVVIGFEVSVTGAAGLRVITLNGDPGGSKSQASGLLADEILKQLAERGSVVKKATTGSDLVLEAFSVPGVRISLGVESSKEDQTLFRDTAWSDGVARAIYRGIGERYGSP